MKITALQIQNLRGFINVQKTDLSNSINLFVGPNNSGKSTLLNCIFYLQRYVFGYHDITIGQSFTIIDLFVEGSLPPILPEGLPFDHLQLEIKSSGVSRHFILPDGSKRGGLDLFKEQEPLNLIYPYLSKRKTVNYNSTINQTNANSVSGNFTNLYSKIDRLITPQYQPGNQQYINACNEVLGFEISTLASEAGKQAVYFIDKEEYIPLTAMGEGVANIIGLITDLCVAENRIFLIEEPENDIHPRALKALLKIIIEKSLTNQFFISTHSNIVMKYLGGVEGSKVFYVKNVIRDNARGSLHLSSISLVSNDPEERRCVLEDLGYDFFDFDLWKGWLFLEESSAEIIIRDYLIDWFVKPLKNKIRTFSVGGVANLITKFDDFDRLFVFLHLVPTYKNKVWVIIDGGLVEQKIIFNLKEKYTKTGWDESNFKQFNEHDFEKYYPKEFQKKVTKVINIKDKQKKREEKKNLLEEVINWIKRDENKAKDKFKESANEVIEHLKIINKKINS
jgi:hypothetical protein